MSKRTILGLSVALFAVTALVVGTPVNAQIYEQNTVSYGQTAYRNLTIGSAGADVSALQSFLSSRGYAVSISGYFDNQTRNAVVQYQASHGIPATGFFGPLTRGAYNAEVGGGIYGNTYGNGTIPPGYPTVTACPPGYTPTIHLGLRACVKYTVVDHGSNNGDLNGGEVNLDNFEVDEGSDVDDIEEGDSNVEVMDISFDVDDGDLELDRAKFVFEFTGDEDEADEKPWEVFDHASILSDGDEIAEIDTDSKSDWDKDGDRYILTFDDLDNEILPEGDSAELTLVLDIANNVEGSDNGDASWDISVEDDGIRGFDGDRNTQEIGDEDDTVNITIDNDSNNDDDDDNSNDERLIVSDSSDTPDEDDIEVFENSRTNFEEVFAFEIEARDNDIDLNSLPITLNFLDNGSFNDYVDSIKLEIDGDDFTDFTVDDNNDEAIVTFDLDNDVTIDEDDTVTVRLFIRFNEQDDNYDDGDQIEASITSENVDDIEAEGDDTLETDQLSGSAEGESQTLQVD